MEWITYGCLIVVAICTVLVTIKFMTLTAKPTQSYEELASGVEYADEPQPQVQSPVYDMLIDAYEQAKKNVMIPPQAFIDKTFEEDVDDSVEVVTDLEEWKRENNRRG